MTRGSAFARVLFASSVLASVLVASPASAAPPGADLAVAVAAPTPLADGSPVVADITVTNLGVSPSASIVPVQLFLIGATAATATGPGWTCGAPVVAAFTISMMCNQASGATAPGGSLPALHVVATSSLELTTTWVFTTVTDPGGLATNNTASTTVETLRADLTVVASVPYVGIPRGGTTQVAMHVVNTGTALSLAPTLTLTTVGFTAVSAQGPGWSCTTVLPVRCTGAPALGPMVATAPITVTATAVSANVDGSISATVSSDTNTANNTATEIVAIGDHPDITPVVTPVAAAVMTGATASFKVDVRNVGQVSHPAPIFVNVVVSDLENPHGAAPGWTCTAVEDTEDELSCKRTGSIAAGATSTFTVQGTVVGEYPGDVGVTATTTAADDLNFLNDNAEATASVLPALASAVTLDPSAPLTFGGTASFVVHVRGIGASALPGPTTVDFTALGANLAGTGTGWSCTPGSCVSNATIPSGTEFPPLTLRGPVTAAPGGQVVVDVAVDNAADETDDDDEGHQTAPVAAGDTTPPSNVVISLGSAFATLNPTVPFSWGATDPSGIRDYDVRIGQVAPKPGNSVVWATYKNATKTTTGSIKVLPGRTVCGEVRAHDNAGNTSSWSSTGCTAVPYRADQLAASGTWVREKRSDVYGGLVRTSSTQGAKLSMAKAQVRYIGVVVTRCPTCGSLAVRFNGSVVATLNLAAPTTQRSALLIAGGVSTLQSGSITLEVASSGKPVSIEGLVVYGV